MSTPASVGYKGSDGRVEYIFVKLDGMPSRLGKVLYASYRSLDKLKEAMKNGDLISLYPDPKSKNTIPSKEGGTTKSAWDSFMYANASKGTNAIFLATHDSAGKLTWYVKSGKSKSDSNFYLLKDVILKAENPKTVKLEEFEDFGKIIFKDYFTRLSSK